MPCPSTLRSAPLCLCEITPFHAFALLRSSFHAFALLFHATALLSLATPLLLSAMFCPCDSVPCTSLPLLCITLHSPCSALRCGSPALHRCSMLCRRYSSLRLASPWQSMLCLGISSLLNATAIQFSTMPSPNTSSQHITIAKRLFANQCPRCAVPFTAKPLRYTAIRAVAYSTISYRNLPQEAFLHWPRPFNCP